MAIFDNMSPCVEYDSIKITTGVSQCTCMHVRRSPVPGARCPVVLACCLLRTGSARLVHKVPYVVQTSSIYSEFLTLLLDNPYATPRVYPAISL